MTELTSFLNIRVHVLGNHSKQHDILGLRSVEESSNNEYKGFLEQITVEKRKRTLKVTKLAKYCLITVGSV